MNDDGELSADERTLLTDARVAITPPARVEHHIVAALRERPRAPWYSMRWAAAAALVVAAFVAGAAWQRGIGGTTHNASPKFMLVLYGGEAGNFRSEYEDWARAIAQQGIAITGEELGDASREIPAPDATGPAAASMRGFFIVEVSDVDAAQQIAASCPHLRHGGHVAIRPIVAGRASVDE